jgi:D-aminopeptidase
MTAPRGITESGQLEGPVMLTNTHSVGVVRDAVIAERVRAGGADASGYWWSLAGRRRDLGRATSTTSTAST